MCRNLSSKGLKGRPRDRWGGGGPVRDIIGGGRPPSVRDTGRGTSHRVRTGTLGIKDVLEPRTPPLALRTDQGPGRLSRCRVLPTVPESDLPRRRRRSSLCDPSNSFCRLDRVFYTRLLQSDFAPYQGWHETDRVEGT